jgi:hypothetical protein
MAKEKKKKGSRAKSRRASLKSFARRGSAAYPQKFSTDKELVYGNGKNYKVGPGDDFASANAGAAAADGDGKAFIYLDGALNTTAGGRARVANSTHTAGTTLNLSI